MLLIHSILQKKTCTTKSVILNLHWCGTVKGIIWFLWLLSQVCSREMKKVFQRESSCNFIQLPIIFCENKVSRFLSLKINIFVIAMTRKRKIDYFYFPNPMSWKRHSAEPNQNSRKDWIRWASWLAPHKISIRFWYFHLRWLQSSWKRSVWLEIL